MVPASKARVNTYGSLGFAGPRRQPTPSGSSYQLLCLAPGCRQQESALRTLLVVNLRIELGWEMWPGRDSSTVALRRGGLSRPDPRNALVRWGAQILGSLAPASP
jgi:hypothetical protein